ncbi:EamA family transporter RarD [Mailhella sp.]|uniref:EamA family transporter RarD n=1 Tax=Mailhella sp. TaxID=1981029 RepID=UPI0040633E0A
MAFPLSFQKHECTASCAGTGAGLGAHLLWGFAVLFWPLLTGMDPISIMSHRMIWTAVFLAFVLAFTGQLGSMREAFRAKRVFLPLAAAAFLLALNWTLYIWGVTSGQVVESTLGYFITPLLNVLMGRLFLGETLSKAQAVSIGLAFVAVAASIIAFGHVPWLGLVLATTFALYGFVQKTLRMPAAASLFIQALILMPAAFLWLFITEEGMGMTGHGALRPVLLVCTVFFTGLPLMMFGYAARRVTLATIGILQYVSPSIAFLLAVTVLGEGIKQADMISFPVIWLALAIYTWDALHHLHRTKEKA